MSTTNSMTFENELITLWTVRSLGWICLQKSDFSPEAEPRHEWMLEKMKQIQRRCFSVAKLWWTIFRLFDKSGSIFYQSIFVVMKNMKSSSPWYLWFQQLGSMTFCLDDNSGAETNIVEIFALQIKYLDCKFKCNFTIVQLLSIRQIRLNSKIAAPNTMWQSGKKRGSSVVKLNSTGLGLRGL